MQTSRNPRQAISPFVALSFAVISITGVMLFFHFKNGPIMVLHEWFGWGFIIAGVAHTVLNWRPLVACLKQRSGILSLGFALILMLVMIIAGASHDDHGRSRAHQDRNQAASPNKAVD